jgi:hypothetical protein
MLILNTACGGCKISANVKYTWYVTSGTDLDTRTVLTNPVTNPVGYGYPDVDGVSFSGDNTGSGTELVVIDIDKLRGDLNTITGFLEAHWFGTKLDGRVDLSVELLVGACVLSKSTKEVVVTTTTENSNYSYDAVGSFSIDLRAMTVTLT